MSGALLEEGALRLSDWLAQHNVFIRLREERAKLLNARALHRVGGDERIIAASPVLCHKALESHGSIRLAGSAFFV